MISPRSDSGAAKTRHGNFPVCSSCGFPIDSGGVCAIHCSGGDAVMTPYTCTRCAPLAPEAPDLDAIRADVAKDFPEGIPPRTLLKYVRTLLAYVDHLRAEIAAGSGIPEEVLALIRLQHYSALGASPLFSVQHWQHNAGPAWPHEPDDDSYIAFENCQHPACKWAREATR